MNPRGNGIEQVITGDRTAHRLEDLAREFGDGQLSIDIKTKLLDAHLLLTWRFHAGADRAVSIT